MKIEVNTGELNTLILCAFRYALGRKSYIVSDIASLISDYSEHIEPHIKERICKEIKEAIENNNYGMDMDKQIWSDLQESINAKPI